METNYYICLQSSPNSSKSRRQKSQANTSADNLIDETTLIETDSSNNSLLNQQSTRSRKQHLIMNSDNENSNQSDANDSSNQDSSKAADSTLMRTEYDFDENDDKPESAEGELGQKRLRVRSTKNALAAKAVPREESTGATARDSSPPRKSARIANK